MIQQTNKNITLENIQAKMFPGKQNLCLFASLVLLGGGEENESDK